MREKTTFYSFLILVVVFTAMEAPVAEAGIFRSRVGGRGGILRPRFLNLFSARRSGMNRRGGSPSRAPGGNSSSCGPRGCGPSDSSPGNQPEHAQCGPEGCGPSEAPPFQANFQPGPANPGGRGMPGPSPFPNAPGGSSCKPGDGCSHSRGPSAASPPYAPPPMQYPPNGYQNPSPSPNHQGAAACRPGDGCDHSTPPGGVVPAPSPDQAVRPVGSPSPFVRALEVFSATSVGKLTDEDYGALKAQTFSLSCQQEPLGGTSDNSTYVARIKAGSDEDRFVFRPAASPGDTITDGEFNDGGKSMPIAIAGKGLVAQSPEASATKFELKVLGAGASTIVAIRITQPSGYAAFCLDSTRVRNLSEANLPVPQPAPGHKHGDSCKH